MTTPPLETTPFLDQPLPILKYLSPESRQGLETYIQQGNVGYRTRLVLELLKSLDWLSLAELDQQPNNPLKKLPPDHQQQIMTDIQQYLLEKNQKRAARSKRRDTYKEELFAYFRKNVPAQDKILLEQLRDFELAVTNQDKNWRYYFTFRSFKRINAFVAMTVTEREALIQRFKADVIAYQKNLESYHEQIRTSEKQTSWGFDDWCDTVQMSDLFGTRQQQRHQKDQGGQTKQTQKEKTSQRTSSFKPPRSRQNFQQDYRFLGLPEGSPFNLVKKRFRQLVRTHHPDVHGGSHQEMQAILAAYERLQKHLLTP